MIRFNAKKFAKQLKESKPTVEKMTVQVADNDLCLVVNVFDEEGNLIGQHDTGLDGNDDTTEADKLADELVETLQSGRKANRVQAKRFDYDFDSDDQWSNLHHHD